MNNSSIPALKNNYKKMSIIERIKNLIICPNKLMDYIETKPDIMFPILFTIIFNISVVLIKFDDFKLITKNKLLVEFQGTELSVTDQLVNSTIIITPIFYIIMFFISILLLAIIFYGFIKLLKGRGYFKQYVSIMAYSSIVNLIGLFVLMILSIWTGKFLFSTNFSICDALNINVNKNFLTICLSKVTLSSILSLWQHILIAIGVVKISEINPKYIYSFTITVYIISLLLVN